jgi:hypothetical protein
MWCTVPHYANPSLDASILRPDVIRSIKILSSNKVAAVLAVEPENPHAKLEHRRLQQRIAHAQACQHTANNTGGVFLKGAAPEAGAAAKPPNRGLVVWQQQC